MTASSPGFTLLRTSTHLVPQAEDKAKRAVGAVFERVETVADGPLGGPRAASTTDAPATAGV